ncbi:MAG: SprT family zinc-dependent metalloprotease [Mariprofundaceae bacterium]|nr:SprT family zinc-dependent metalloprotease [Mariprofundaceae bacterium]
MIVKPSFVYGDKTYEYSVQFLSSRKKTISIHVLPNATVEVKAPSHTDKQKIVETMKKRARWVVKHVEQIQRSNDQVLPREYVSGETHFYLGRRYQLKVIPSDTNQVKLSRGMFMIEITNTSRGKVKGLLENWYKEHARLIFEKHLTLITANIDWLDMAPPMTIRQMKKQWGSCSPMGRISLNSNLVKAPAECIDYVITHELCHLHEHNHSKKFYALQNQYSPNWKAIKAKLDGMAEQLLNNE